jgi:ATP diphosphatase
VVNVARHLDVDPETALHTSAAKFRDRFMAVEALVAARHPEGAPRLDLAAWDALWDEVKRAATADGASSTLSNTNHSSHISTTPRGLQDP